MAVDRERGRVNYSTVCFETVRVLQYIEQVYSLRIVFQSSQAEYCKDHGHIHLVSETRQVEASVFISGAKCLLSYPELVFSLSFCFLLTLSINYR